MTDPRFDPPEGSPDPGGCTAGAQFLRDAVLSRWPDGTSFGGCYLHGGLTDGGTPSFHGVGRAVDIMIAADHIDIGEQIFSYLYDHRNEVGLNEVIFNSKIWYGGNASAGVHPYTVNRHLDHVHMAINVDAANRALPWYQGAFPEGDGDLLADERAWLEEVHAMLGNGDKPGVLRDIRALLTEIRAMMLNGDKPGVLHDLHVATGQVNKALNIIATGVAAIRSKLGA